MEEKKTQAQLLKEKLFMKRRNAAECLEDEEIQQADRFCEPYKAFLNTCKMERETVDFTVALLEKQGFVPFDTKRKYVPGDKVYYNNRGKSIIFAAVGKRPLSEGVRIVASHIDSPRVDLKPCPLYEDNELALFKTHYYGGIKKYQWGALPLALHGVIIKKDGETIKVNVGEDPGDPIFCITDLLPHLADEQMKRGATKILKGEELNVLVGSRPFKDDKGSELVKLNILNLLNEKYGIIEADFLSAELCCVPLQNARDLGFDRSMIGAYGHDDRVCAYTSLMACLDAEDPEYTWVNVFADKEETGSDGNTGMKSAALRYFITDLAAPYGISGREVLSHSKCLSADVNAAFDPTFASVSEKNNSAYLNKGVVITKYTGAGGKSSTNDASAEFMYEVRRLLDEKEVIWQTGELGKVDAGGGGTVAKFISELNVDTVDLGVPVLSMHAPFEVVSKLDVYMTYRAFKEFITADR